jgi:hypothetical protein
MSNSIVDNLTDLTGATQNYIKATLAYHKLDLYKKIMLTVVSSIHKLLTGLVGLLSLMFLSFALAIYLGEMMGSAYLGYLVVGALYLVLCLAAMLFLKPLVEKALLRKSSTKWFNEILEPVKNDHEESL